MQRDKEFEHKRIRYYRTVIDLNSLKINQDYDKLPPAVIIILSPFGSFAGHKVKVFPNGLSAGRAGHCLKRRIAGLWGQFQGDDLLGQSDHAEILGFDERRCRHERNIGEKRSEKRGIKIGEERTLIQNLRYLVESGMSPDEAMVRLKVPSEKREEYRKLIEPQKV